MNEADQAIWDAMEASLRARFTREQRPPDWFAWLDHHTEGQKQAAVNLKRAIDHDRTHGADTSWVQQLPDEHPIPSRPQEVVAIVSPKQTHRRN